MGSSTVPRLWKIRNTDKIVCILIYSALMQEWEEKKCSSLLIVKKNSAVCALDLKLMTNILQEEYNC